MNKKSSNPISVRLTNEIAEKFRNYSQNYAKSQSDFIEILLKRFDDTQKSYSNAKNYNNSDIDVWVFMNYSNLFIKDKKNQYKSLKKYHVKGKYVYWYSNRYIYVPSTQYDDILKKEFNITEELENYEFSFWFGVLWDNTVNKYLLVETFSLIQETKKGIKIEKLNVNRCKHFTNIYEIKNCVKKFCSTQELIRFEQIIAPETTIEELSEYWD